MLKVVSYGVFTEVKQPKFKWSYLNQTSVGVNLVEVSDDVSMFFVQYRVLGERLTSHSCNHAPLL